jgi:hypothetical protein
MKSIADKLAGNPLHTALGVGLLLVVAYLLIRKTLSDVAGAAAGIVTGDNALTKGTDYEGTGVLGTLGAGASAATGGGLEDFGSWLGGGAADAAESLRQFFNSSNDKSLYYTVTFPDGVRHAIQASTVSKTGGFTYAGRAYQMFDDAKGYHFAKVA